MCYYQYRMKSLLQTKEWAEFRQTQGWRVHWVDEILVLEKSLPLGLSFLYSPEVDFYKINWQKKDDPSTSLRMTSFLQKVGQIAKNSNSVFLRLDFINQKNNFFGAKLENILKQKNFIKSFEEIQPEFRQIIDISKTDQQILSQMKPKGRYNIKIAEKNNVIVEKNDIVRACRELDHDELLDSLPARSKNNLDIFYHIFKETASRDGFEIRPKSYFENLLKILQPAGLADLLVCRYNGKAIAAGIITFYNDTASYLYGASSNEDRNLMAPYLMHWEVIKEAKARDCNFYDLLAVAPFDNLNPKTLNLKPHKYAGITRFKEQFGGHKIQTVGSWDMIIKPTWYGLFKLVEKHRRS